MTLDPICIYPLESGIESRVQYVNRDRWTATIILWLGFFAPGNLSVGPNLISAFTQIYMINLPSKAAVVEH